MAQRTGARPAPALHGRLRRRADRLHACQSASCDLTRRPGTCAMHRRPAAPQCGRPAWERQGEWCPSIRASPHIDLMRHGPSHDHSVLIRAHALSRIRRRRFTAEPRRRPGASMHPLRLFHAATISRSCGTRARKLSRAPGSSGSAAAAAAPPSPQSCLRPRCATSSSRPRRARRRSAPRPSHPRQSRDRTENLLASHGD